MPSGIYTRTKHHIDIATANLPKDTKKEKNGFWKSGLPRCIDCGKELSRYDAKRCMKHNDVLEVERLRKTHLGNKAWNSGTKHVKISGENHWNYKGGVTPENNKIRTSLEYKLWHKSVLERDNFTCQKYGTIGGALRAHHINNFAEFPELRTSIENGITLSKKAHEEFHKKYGIKNNTKGQLEEFLKL